MSPKQKAQTAVGELIAARMVEQEKAQHTPGPWFVQEHTEQGFGGSVTFRTVSAPSKFGPVSIPLNSTNDKYPEAAANAYLIASAPDLLRACEKVLAAIEWSETKERMTAEEQAEVLRAAIALATGAGE